MNKKTLGILVAISGIIGTIIATVQVGPTVYAIGKRFYAVTECPDRLAVIEKDVKEIKAQISTIAVNQAAPPKTEKLAAK